MGENRGHPRRRGSFLLRSPRLIGASAVDAAPTDVHGRSVRSGRSDAPRGRQTSTLTTLHLGLYLAGQGVGVNIVA